MERRSWIKTTVGVGVLMVFGWYAFVRGTRVPLLGGVDLGFHELGHLLTYVFPDMVTAAAGSAAQILVPAGLAGYFWWRKDWLGAGICLGWAGASSQDVSVYIADAPYEALPLIGGEHDWAYLLGPEQFDVVDKAAGLAATVRAGGFLLWLGGLAICIAGPWIDRRRTTRDTGAGPTSGSTSLGTGRASGGSGGWAVIPPWEQPRPPQDNH